MPADERGSGGRINLARPGKGPRRPRSRRWLAVAAAVAVVGGLAAGGYVLREPIGRGVRSGASAVWDAWASWSTTLRDRAAAIPEPPPTTTVPPPEPVASRSLLVAIGTGVGDSAFALLVLPPTGDALVVLIPQTLLVQVPGYGEFSMSEALGFEGPGLARLALANEMGIRVDDVLALPGGGTTAVADGLVVDVPVELYVEEADGSRRLIAAGPQRLSSDLVELLLVEEGTGDQFDWLRRQEAVWEGLLGAIAAEPAAATRLAAAAGDPDEAAAVLRAVAAVPSIGAPPLDRVAVGADRDAFVLATERIGEYLSGTLGHLALREGRRPRVEILNGNGVAGSGVPVAEVVVGAEFYVLRSGNADRFDYAASQVIAQGEDAVPAAREAAGLLGVADLLLEARAPSGVVDVSIIVGTDLASMEG